VTDRLSRNPGN